MAKTSRPCSRAELAVINAPLLKGATQSQAEHIVSQTLVLFLFSTQRPEFREILTFLASLHRKEYTNHLVAFLSYLYRYDAAHQVSFLLSAIFRVLGHPVPVHSDSLVLALQVR